jgi:RNA polymerase primary sigma factor
MSALMMRVRGASRVCQTSGRSPGPSLAIVNRDGILDRPANTGRAGGLLGTPIEYIPHPSFDDPAASEAILAPMPVPADGQSPRRTSIPTGVPTYLAVLCETPLLSAAQEAHQFRKMNYLKFLAERARARLDPVRAEPRDLEGVASWHGQAVAVRDQIIRANLRLVVSLAKRYQGPYDDISERVSDGNVALTQAVDRFDYARGNKFSTYASWAIINSFRRRRRDQNDRGRFLTGHEERLKAAADTRADEHDQEKAHQQRQRKVKRLLGRLDDRERWIIANHYGIGGTDAKSLKQIGKELGISQERVRQIEVRAQVKLRGLARREALDLLPA